MGKRKGRRQPVAQPPKILELTKPVEETAKASSTPIPPATGCHTTSPQSEQRRSRLLIGWEKFWAFAGPLVSILSLAQYYWPAISITTGANLRPRDLFQTDFIVTNTGHTSVYDVSFTCGLIGTSVAIGVVTNEGNDLAKIPELLPNHPASRGCFGRSLMAGGPWIKVSADYKWPLIGRVSRETAFFSAKQNDKGENQLVPEAAPPPNWGTFFEFKSPEN